MELRGEGEVAGEVVFTTSMVGYQETVTDPSYRGQIVLFTYPLIGNYGVIPGDDESRKVQAAGVLVREYTPHPSNWASERSLAALLEESGVIGVEGIDTRALTRHLRDKGAMRGVISTSDHDTVSLREKAYVSPLDGRPGPRLHELRADRACAAARPRRGALPGGGPRLRREGLDLRGAQEPGRLRASYAWLDERSRRYSRRTPTASSSPTGRVTRLPSKTR